MDNLRPCRLPSVCVSCLRCVGSSDLALRGAQVDRGAPGAACEGWRRRSPALAPMVENKEEGSQNVVLRGPLRKRSLFREWRPRFPAQWHEVLYIVQPSCNCRRWQSSRTSARPPEVCVAICPPVRQVGSLSRVMWFAMASMAW